MPERVFQRSMAVDEVLRQLVAVELVEEGDLRVRGRDRRPAARSSSPESQRHAGRPAVARPGSARPARRPAPRRRSARAPRAARRSPRPCRPPGSPRRRAGCRRRRRRPCGGPSRSRCPGERGPAHVPMTPLTDSTPLSCGLSKWSSTRSAMLDVNSRVRSPAVAHVDAAEPPAEPGRGRAGRPGASSRPWAATRRQQRAEHVGQPRRARRPTPPWRRRRRAENLRDLLVPRARVVGELQVAAVRVGREVRALGVDLVAVPLELQLPQDRRRHEADDVGERRHLVVGTPRRLGDGRPADHVAPLEHRPPAARPWPAARRRPGRCGRRR